MAEYMANVTAHFGLNITVSPLAVLNTSDIHPYGNTSTSAQEIPSNDLSNFHCGEGMQLYRFIIQVVLTLPVCVIGIFGNVMAFAVLCYQKQKVSTTLLLQALCVVDTILLVMAIILRTIRYIDICFGNKDLDLINYSQTFIILYPSAFTFRMINVWLTTFLTFDRWIAVCRPLHAQRLVTKRMALIHMTIVIVGAIVISLPKFFEYGIIIKPGDGYQIKARPLAHNFIYTILYKIIVYFTCMYIIPMVTLLVLNIKLVKALQTADKDRKVLQHASDSIQQNRNITAMVIIVVAAFLICNILPLCSQILHNIELAYPSLRDTVEDPRRKMSNFSDLMLTINSAINFIIYCVCSKKFRKTLVSMLSCKKKSDLKYLTKTGPSSTSGLTYLSLTRSRSSSASAHKSTDRAQTYA